MTTPPRQHENSNPSALTGAPTPIPSETETAQSGKRPGIGRKLLVAAIALTGFGFAVYFLGTRPRIENSKELAATAATAARKTVTVVKPTEASNAPELTLPGNVQANQMASIYSRVDGYLKRWYVDIGDRVQAGQILAEIEAPQVDADLRMAQAELELAKANLRLAQTNSARSQELFQNRVNSQQELDTVLANEQVQAANRNRAAAALTSAQDNKGFEQIRAPFAGTITARYVEVGSLVASGSGRTVQKLFDLAQSDSLRVFVNVPQAEISNVKPGTTAAITVDEFPGQTFAGTIARDAGAFDLTSRTLLLEIDVPNPDGRLYSGMYVRARFALQNPAPALLLADNAIQIDAKGIRVFVVDSGNKIEIKPVTLGRDFGTKSQILTGLAATDRVVQNPTPDLYQGMPVSAQPADH